MYAYVYIDMCVYIHCTYNTYTCVAMYSLYHIYSSYLFIRVLCTRFQIYTRIHVLTRINANKKEYTIAHV